MSELRTAVVIPARYGSSRFPGKVLAQLVGKPMIQHVYERASASKADICLIAADDQRVIDACKAFGATAIMTDPELPSGTDRIAAALKGIDADVVINVPVLKNHGGAVMTCAMKNYMGVVWDRRMMHKSLAQSIVDSVLIRKPDLNVVDASLVMTTGGPTGRSPKTKRVRMDSLLMSRDIVAVDTAALKMLRLTLPEIKDYLAMGEAQGLGTRDLTKLKIKRIV